MPHVGRGNGVLLIFVKTFFFCVTRIRQESTTFVKMSYRWMLEGGGSTLGKRLFLALTPKITPCLVTSPCKQNSTQNRKISYILQGEIEAFFPRGGCNSQGCVFPEPKAREIRIRGSWHPPRGKIFNFSQEFVILLPPNSAESQNFRGF